MVGKMEKPLQSDNVGDGFTIGASGKKGEARGQFIETRRSDAQLALQSIAPAL